MVKLLENAGCEVLYNPAQTCCGQPAFNAGYQDDAAAVAKKFCKDFSGKEPIISPSGSCTGFVRNYYQKMLSKDASNTPQRVFELTEFLTGTLGIKRIEGFFEGKAVYHDACGALRECGIKSAPRELLSGIRGLELIEMKEAETCCGFGGTFAVKYEPISIGMAQTKVESAIEAGADYIISTDVSCLMHLQGYIDKMRLPLKTLHIADVLAAGTN